MNLILAVIIGVAVFSLLSQKDGVKILSCLLGIGTCGLILFLVVALALDHRENTKQEKVKAWERSRYSGWRIRCDGGMFPEWPNGEHPCDARKGVWVDEKAGIECTDSGYPSLPVCPKQEYLINGQTEPTPVFDAAAIQACVNAHPFISRHDADTGFVLTASIPLQDLVILDCERTSGLIKESAYQTRKIDYDVKLERAKKLDAFNKCVYTMSSKESCRYLLK